MTFEELQYIVTLMREEAARREAEYREVKKLSNDLDDGYITEDEAGEDADTLRRKAEELGQRSGQAEAYLRLFLSYDWKT